jgi:HTH-type transcriptional regulator / antitoxin HigA
LVKRDKVEGVRDSANTMNDMQPHMPDWFSMPSEALRMQMTRRALKLSDVAKEIRGGMATLLAILEGTKSIDMSVAEDLAPVLGGTVNFWIKRQQNFDVAFERAVDRAFFTESEDWLSLPVPGEKPRGPKTQEILRAEVLRRMRFYNTSTRQAWDARYGKVCSDTLFRKSNVLTSDKALVLMWLRTGEIRADQIDTKPWNSENLRGQLDQIRKLSKQKDPKVFFPKLRDICSEAGVAIVAKRAPVGCPASGASRMITNDKALILLSFRGLSDDKFWFTVFHEIGHLLLHNGRTFVDTNMDETNELEMQANAFASECIIHERNQDEFKSLVPNREKVIRFSVRTGVSPGLIVGQMQHHQMINQNQLNYLKRHWKWDQLGELVD